MIINFHAIKTENGWTIKKRYGIRDIELKNISNLDLILELSQFEEELEENNNG